MKRMIIQGGNRLSGEVTIGGAKNSTVALIPAAILADTPVEFDTVPDILDVHNLMIILESMNVKSSFTHGFLEIDPTQIIEAELPSKAIKSLRASYYFMGALLGRFHRATLTFPGGDNIGPRPIDQHLKAFKALGASVSENNGTVHLDAPNGLHGTRIFLDMVSVGATINTILASVRAEGTTVIENAAKEPEIIDLATFLNNMGAQIRGAGTDTIRITGVDTLQSMNTHTIIADRIESGTYLAMAAAVGDGVMVHNVIPEHLESFTSKMIEMGVDLQIDSDKIYVPRVKHLKAIHVKTMPFPGFATDLQQPLTPLMSLAEGDSTVVDTIYPKRVKHIPELQKMGMKIEAHDGMIVIKHTDHLHGAEVTAGEIRAGASLTIAGLMAEGTTVINNAGNILRGYDRIVWKLNRLGAKVSIEDDSSVKI
ncbi:UDP-N-acetylglucosamine 1-carboxyvinyltransferase [Limosilactobacillus vaginalis]|jgi:UDP-N-acetylglucosamine 1-carboxyvinyltransferase|uniref:UDP-N-acetylglucosamine 1-carboxyvinyltransferase n=2 Tax=Limosilactobacillus vaginalis TaxID=1633 RepID=A0AAP3GSN9_9LACO|nr:MULTISPECIES: UDP-N-acetylglucosamine 1-carboxyvinyltransferase [Limosilactobacillus]PEH04702.1 UDP-N-acetylglucosamine 1-carboxyvinyltransferase [Lactobacillus sp. UMNPBX5]EEJ41500.1 UDP-N-acetylglucosamine 1-carboxyvinyltransferase [Limosilactobacillus vaginalis DSM 5837 = ATCC 49540]MCI6853204.1 UDP-N-acetylglucosamine 1-carboxyvinyltransferase [Limosilactobacillus vaginalis]MCZ2465077.1 UDP-N-acetylglucosamine 1-carboxyvinyltransferase [Limosilactobacillus vaginalis]MCZ3667308.1 UDP-N-a